MNPEKLFMDEPTKKSLAAFREAIEGRYSPSSELMEYAIAVGETVLQRRRIIRELIANLVAPPPSTSFRSFLDSISLRAGVAIESTLDALHLQSIENIDESACGEACDRLDIPVDWRIRISEFEILRSEEAKKLDESLSTRTTISGLPDSSPSDKGETQESTR